MNSDLRKLRKNTQSGIEQLRSVSSVVSEETEKIDKHLNQVQSEYRRVSEVSASAPAVIENIDRQFAEKTKLNGTDIPFLMLGTAIQCARQYLLTNDKFRLTDKQGDQMMEKVVPANWQDVLLQSVPYDAIQTGEHVSDTGLGGTTHRYRTLGHDPVLGWVFGTANIMTNSLTKTDFVTTYQVKNMKIIRRYPLGTPGMLNKTVKYAHGDPLLLGASVVRQAIHFGSDYFTKQGLPVPFLSTVNNDLVKTMITEGNIDMWSITRGAAVSAFINQLVALIHRLFYDPDRDGSISMYEVRTRKILSYSNAIATGSNIVVTAVTKDLTKLDVGGMIVTLHRLVSDYSFIQSVKREFLQNEVYRTVVGSPYDFMEVN